MALVVWVMMGIAVWHFTVWLPDRFWGGIVGAFLGALVGSIVFGLIVNGGSVPGQDDTDLLTGLEAVPGAVIGRLVAGEPGIAIRAWTSSVSFLPGTVSPFTRKPNRAAAVNAAKKAPTIPPQKRSGRKIVKCQRARPIITHASMPMAIAPFRVACCADASVCRASVCRP